MSTVQPAWPSLDREQEDPVERELCVQRVLDAYANAIKSSGKRDHEAFDAAVRVSRKHNPDASPEMAGPAVATILCRKL